MSEKRKVAIALFGGILVFVAVLGASMLYFDQLTDGGETTTLLERGDDELMSLVYQNQQVLEDDVDIVIRIEPGQTFIHLGSVTVGEDIGKDGLSNTQDLSERIRGVVDEFGASRIVSIEAFYENGCLVSASVVVDKNRVYPISGFTYSLELCEGDDSSLTLRF